MMHMRSRLSDRCYGQWLILHVPFKAINDFYQPIVDERVPEAYHNIAMAWLCQQPIARSWMRDDSAIDLEMKMESHNYYHIQSVIGYIRSQTKLVDDFITGRLAKDAPVGVASSETIAKPMQLPDRTVRMPIKAQWAAMIPHQKDVEARIDKDA